MEKLNELVEALYPQYGAPGSRDVEITARRKAIDESAASIAEAFRALEQRAEAAEAKLAEYEKQNPKLEYIRRLETELAQLRARPAAAVSLAELVPDAPTGHKCPEHILDPFSWACGAEWFRAAILRNIEEANK